MKRAFALLRSLLLLLSLACGCRRQEETVLRYDLPLLPRSLDPQFADPDDTAAQLLLTNLFTGLTRLSPEGSVIPGCAERWEVSADGLTYTFTLRGGLQWADGSALTADDFVFGISRLFEVPHIPPCAGFYTAIENADAVMKGEKPLSALGVGAAGDDTVILTLERPAAEILTLLARPAAAPCSRAFFAEQKGRYGLDREALLTNGAFLLRAWSESGVSLRRSETYFSPAAIDGVDFAVNDDPAARYLADETDACLFDGPAAKENGLTGISVRDRTWSLLLNPARPAGGDENLRRALLAAIEAETLSDRPGDAAEPAAGLIAPSHTVLGAPYREAVGPVRAPALPADARQTMLDAFAALQTERFPKATLLICDDAVSGRIGGALLQNWSDTLSAYVNLEAVPYQTLLSRVRNGQFDLALSPLPTESGDDSAGLRLFSALLGANDAYGIGARLAEVSRGEGDAAQALFAAEQAIVDAHLALPVCDTPSVFVCREGISGVWCEPSTRIVSFADAAAD